MHGHGGAEDCVSHRRLGASGIPELHSCGATHTGIPGRVLRRTALVQPFAPGFFSFKQELL
jgi:hypothetical protein